MVVLGIDPGLASVGWAVVDGSGTEPKLVSYGLISTSKNSEHGGRLTDIFEEVQDIINNSSPKPEVMALEELFFAKNAKTAMKVGQAIGAIKIAGNLLGLPIHEYSPPNIKSTITGYGNADKDQVIYMVQQTFKLKEKIKSDHSADAAAIALTHIFTNKKLSL